MNSQATSLRVFFVLLIFGLLSLFTMLTRPSFASIRGVDAVHLIGAGMCFGGAIVALVGYLRGKRA